MSQFQTTLKNAQAIVESWAAKQEDAHGPTLEAAMRHALIGGKALRGFLALESCQLHDLAQENAQRAAFAIECIHAYSLVHDDLPCMDDDDLRRGQPTVHKLWDEAVAVLAGDALQTRAFLTMSDPSMGPHALNAVNDLARRAQMMVRGQMLDIAAETAAEPLSLEQISDLQKHKTGALISWAASIGPVLAGTDASALLSYGDKLGLAFQIADDVLDVEGDEEEVGKALRKDEEAGKATFVTHLGLDSAKKRAKELVEEAKSAVERYGSRAENLMEAADFVIARRK